MRYFDRYTSVSTGASGTQSWFAPALPEKWETSRSYFRSFVSGTYRFSLLYTNIVDSTFADGSHSHKNQLCEEWEIASATVAVTDTADAGTDATTGMPVTFGGCSSLRVMPGAFFTTDPVELTVRAGQYIRVAMTYRGAMLPCHPESILPHFVRRADGWEQTGMLPVPAMVGCDRSVERRVVFLGDSITQGIGTENNSYRHYPAVCAELLGDSYSYWDIGLGYGRADDAASDGAWLYKARQGDVISVCLGVNDLCRGFDAGQICDSLFKTVSALKQGDRKVLLQTVPPFNYTGQIRERWETVNRRILHDLSGVADAVFDNTGILGDGDDLAKAKYGGHPNARGCRLWAEALAPALATLL